MANKAISKVRPGFVRVLIPERNKTIQIRTKLASNPNYMQKHGLVAIPEPKAPPVMQYTEPEPVSVAKEVTEPAPKVTKAAPVKTSRNGQ